MPRFRLPLALLVISSALTAPLAAQQWNAPDALALARRGVQRRSDAAADSALRSYRTRAHGFVFFLAQVGEGLSEPPRLVKADELEVEVYWQAPNRSKQVIHGWRDGAFLPYDIEYHRDHLGIVTNNFGDMIRIGEGDEVRDVVHPLSPRGLDLYDFAIDDSLAVESGGAQLRVYEVLVRPKRFSTPSVVGTLFLSAASAELVRFRFSFTPASYLDRDLEDISIVLENAIWEQRFWLPHRQEIEIRRRSTWLDFPARGIIRGRWEIVDYDLNAELPEGALAGPAIGGLARPQPSDSGWPEPLSQAIAGVATPINQQDMDALRIEVEKIAGARALGGLPSRRLASNSLSDLVHVNRVQGLTLGVGASLAIGASRVRLRPSLAYGTADDRLTGGLGLEVGSGATRFGASASRRIRDFSDLPVIAPVVNSITAQEAGRDYGDYVLLDAASAGVRQRLSGRSTLSAELGIERSHSVAVAAKPANGTYRPNPDLGAGTFRTARLRLERASGGIAVRRDLQGALSVEGGEGPTDYLRATVEGRWLASLGRSEILTRVYGGWGSDGLPAYRSFVLGGRGTLVGEPFRAYGGRQAALAHVEWRFQVPVPAIRLGSFASTGNRMTLAPFAAAGWTDQPVEGQPGNRTGGIRPVVGVAAEWLMRLIRVEAGVGLRDGGLGVTVDISREWWGIL
jgi:hypothetical protein